MSFNKVQSFSFRHAASVGLAVLFAVFISDYFSITTSYWLIATTFLISQTTRGTPFKQNILLLVLITIAMLCATFLIAINLPYFTMIIFILLFILNGFLLFIPLPREVTFATTLFSLSVVVAYFFPTNAIGDVRDRLLAIAIGGGVGIFFSQFILPVRFYSELKQGLLPILHELEACADSFSISLQTLAKERIQFENKLAKAYPDWVFETGFNPGLRAGFRYFLIKINYVLELFFSMDYLLTKKMEASPELANAMALSMQKNGELLGLLATYFEKSQALSVDANLTDDISVLDKIADKTLPKNLELLDVMPQYLTAIALVQDIKDMRVQLLDLLMALPDAVI